MKILIAAINAKYIHSNIAVRYLAKLLEKTSLQYSVKEFTINNKEDFIIKSIYKEKADIVCFSCYIWNIEMTLNICSLIKKISSNTIIILGGPEVSYNSIELMENSPYIDIIVSGRGEYSFVKLVENIETNYKSRLVDENITREFVENDLVLNINDIPGLIYRQGSEIYKTHQDSSYDFDNIPFPYNDDILEKINAKIIYYETQRGCPYNCAYCLSSTEKDLFFLPLNRVFNELTFFIERKVTQVKFIDRTFNSISDRSNKIWDFLIENDNGITNFHFEISADLLNETSLEILKKARKGLFQFEIGVQSTNTETLNAINRHTNMEKLFNNILTLNSFGNIHIHLDLIAGLPYEDYSSFRKSFNDVINLKPQMLQLGFLKLLKGSYLRNEASRLGIVYNDSPPYEVLHTKLLNFDDIIRLKGICHIVDTYYNSSIAHNFLLFSYTFFADKFSFFESLSDYWEERGYENILNSKMQLFTILYEFFVNKISNDENDILIASNLLKYSVLLNDNIKTMPYWANDNLNDDDKQFIRNFYKDTKNVTKYMPLLSEYKERNLKRMCNISKFEFDVTDTGSYCHKKSNKINEQQTFILFNYYDSNRSNVIWKNKRY